MPYRLCGLTIASEALPLDGLAHETADAADVVLRVERAAPPPHTFDHRIEIDGHCVLAFGRNEDAWVIRADELATFLIAKGGGEVVCHPDRGTAAEALRQIFVDRVVPHIADTRGRVAIHASAVSLDDDTAVAFLGAPGAGKSTLSAALCPPFGFVADDCAVLETSDVVLVHPSYHFARLHLDAAAKLDATDDMHVVKTRAHKHRARRDGPTHALRLIALYVLQQGSEMGTAEVGSRDAMVELARHLYRIAPTDRDRLGSELERLERLTSSVPVRLLRYPRRFDGIAALADFIARDARSSTRSPP